MCSLFHIAVIYSTERLVSLVHLERVHPTLIGEFSIYSVFDTVSPSIQDYQAMLPDKEGDSRLQDTGRANRYYNSQEILY